MGVGIDLTVVHYDGAVIFAEWQATIPPGFSYFLVTVFDLDSPFKIEQKTTSTRFTFPAALQADTAYQIYVEMYLDDEPGPTSQFEFVLTQRPEIAAAAYQIGSLHVSWPALTQTGVAGYVATLVSTSGIKSNHDTPQAEITIDQQLDPAFTWQASVAAKTLSGRSTGPSGLARTLVLRPPTLIGVSYDLTETLAAWAHLTQPGAAKFIATLVSTGGARERYETIEDSIEIPGARDPAVTWSLTVAAESADGVVVGPPSQTATLILLAPVLNELDYDAATLSPSWTKVTDASVTGYLVQVDSGSELDNFPVGDVDRAGLAVALSADVTYTIWVMATHDVVAGPVSNALVPLTRPATHVRLDTNLAAQALIADWRAAGGVGVTAYLLQLWRDGVVAETQTPAAPPLTLRATLEAGPRYEVRLRPTGDRVKGPWSPRVPGPWLANVLYSYDRLGRLSTVTWNQTQTIAFTFDDAGNVTAVTPTLQIFSELL